MQSETNGADGLQTEATARTGDAVSMPRLLSLIKEQQFRCSLTGVELEPETANADHIHSLMDGGENTIQNIQIVHQVVNRMKGTMSQDEFIAWCKRVAAHAMGM